MIQLKTAKRAFGYVLLALVLLWVLVSTVIDIRLFLTDHDGIGFYQERPYLLVACVVVAVIIGAAVKIGARVLTAKIESEKGSNQRKGRESFSKNDSRPL